MMRKIFASILILIFLIEIVLPIGLKVHAQEEVTPTVSPEPTISIEPTSAEVSPSPTLVPTPQISEESNIVNPDANVEPVLLQTSLTKDLSAPLDGSSAKIVSPTSTKKRVRALQKKNFRADEKLTVVVDNASTVDTQVKLFNSDGQEMPVLIEVVNEKDPAVMSVEPNYQFQAGRYRMEVTDAEGETTTQDFTWGVLAINTNKSIYAPGETAKLQMAVLDETGIMVCDADVLLEIKSPDGKITTLSTKDSSIKVNPECLIKDFTLTPDFETTYQVGNEGEYNMTLQAETKNGKYTITDTFDVQTVVALDVERITATRLFPPKTYPVTFNITAHEDFEGVITEKVPAIFAITPLAGTEATDSIQKSEQPQLTVLNPAIPQLSIPLEEAWPISQGFGSPPDDPVLAAKYTEYGIVGHDGIDFAAPEGKAILAVDDGEVIYTAEDGEYGKMVVIQHAWGRSYYGHMSQITAVVGQKRERGLPIGMVGSTGLSTGAHLHFGIRPNDYDENNGYKGKINPLPYMGLVKEDDNSGSYYIGVPSDGSAYSLLNWDVKLKKGESIKLGYNYKVPNISPQYYQLGKLTAKNTVGNMIFEESRLWQLAVDADGSGVNTLDTTFGVVSDPDRIYTFTFDPSETMDSGGFTITVPSGWSAPQGTGGTAGYTVATGTGNATVGTVLDEMDSVTGWTQGSAPSCAGTGTISLDTTVFKETTGSIKCVNGNEASGDFFYDNLASTQNWSSYTDVGVWWRSSATQTAGDITYIYDDTAGCASEIGSLSLGAISSANTWTYSKVTLTGTRTSINCHGFQYNHGSRVDNDTFWYDYIIIGPGTPTFSGSGPWTITVPMVDLASTETVTVTYGSGGGTSGVDNSATQGTHTFTTQSRVDAGGTYTSIGISPTITLVGSMGDIMRHGKWFNSSGVIQPFAF